MSDKNTVVRILTSVPVDEVNYKPNDLVEFSNAIAADLVKQKVADDNKDAIAYCKKELDKKVKVHGAKGGEAKE